MVYYMSYERNEYFTLAKISFNFGTVKSDDYDNIWG